jgi:hypothetical protein
VATANIPEIIVLCAWWYLRYPLSYRDLEEMMTERGFVGRSLHDRPLGFTHQQWHAAHFASRRPSD